MMVRLYDVADGSVMVTRRLGRLDWLAEGWQFSPTQPETAVLPDKLHEKTAVFHDADGPLIALRGYTLAEQADGLALILYWEALRDGVADYTRFAHLLGPAAGPPLSQDDGLPQRGTYPTGQWQAGGLIADPVWLPLPTEADGAYEIGVGFYWVENGEFVRLPVYNAAGELFPNATVLWEVAR